MKSRTQRRNEQKCLGRASSGRRYKNDAVSTHKQHGKTSLLCAYAIFKWFFVDLNGFVHLFHVAENHIQVLVVGVQSASKLTIISKLHKDAFIQAETNQIQRLLDVTCCSLKWARDNKLITPNDSHHKQKINKNRHHTRSLMQWRRCVPNWSTH